MEQSEKDALHEVYRGLYDLLGEENMLKLYEHYRGYQIAFPTRLYSREAVQELIEKEYSGHNAKELARRFGYSERWTKVMAAAAETPMKQV